MSWRTLLAPYANPDSAPAMAAYMKHQFPFLGIPQPARKAATSVVIKSAKKWSHDELHDVVEILWKEPEREFHYIAIDLLHAGEKQLTPDDLPWLESLARRHSWWDSIDPLCSPVVNAIALRAPEAGDAIETHWAGHDDFWVRRMAILYQRRSTYRTDRARLFRICLRNAGDKEFFIRKAIGWALREYAKTNPDAVRGFLAEHDGAFSPLTVREATKHLNDHRNGSLLL